MKKEFVRNPYNYDSDELSTATGLACMDESLTEQEHAEEADINYIADRFMRTGEMPTLLQLPTSGDFQGIFDFQTAMNTIVTAKQEFMRLPAKVRSRFGNDPAELLAFVQDESNRDEAIKLGFIRKPDTMDTPNQGEPNDTGTQGSTRKTPQRTARTAGTAADAAEAEGAQKPGRQAAQADRGGDS